MKTIWKFSLYGFNEKISVPKDAKILTLQTQKGSPCIWMLVDTNNELEDRNFYIVGTGHNLNNETIDNYIGTYQEFDGNFIWHVFEKC